MYSHNTMNLTHQHWVPQVVSAGGFNVHCVEGPESGHKTNMHVASRRVKHGDYNETQGNMSNYLCEQSVYRHLQSRMPDTTRASPKPTFGLSRPYPFEFGLNLGRAYFMKSFIHREVRVAVFELRNLICKRFGLSFEQLATTRIVLGKKFTRSDGRVFWGTDSARSATSSSRRDMLFLDGSENGNALCGETICFVQISNLKNVTRTPACRLPDSDCVHLVLIRWLTPHGASWERDALRRPVCPGPLHVNNCLWKYAKTPRPRRSLRSGHGQDTPSCLRQRHFFGTTETEQSACRLRERHAYFGLIEPDTIIDTMHMCSTFKNGTSDPEYGTWLQTVTLF